MTKLHLITFFFIFNFGFSQTKTEIDCSNKTVKVKLVKSVLYDSCKDSGDGKAFILEFIVVKTEDQKIYGERLYVITPCFDFLGDGVYKENYVWDLEISECKYYLREFEIYNEELLEKNVEKKRYWNRGISRKQIFRCGVENK